MTRRFSLAIAAVALLISGAVTVTLASPASGVAPTLLSRATFPSFKVAGQHGPNMYKAEAKAPVDILVRQHDYAPGGTTGWHQHPYPVMITVLKGTLTFYDYHDPTCTGIEVSEGGGYVDSGHGHLARNETGEPAVDISVITAPVGGAFRTELDAPSPHCGF